MRRLRIRSPQPHPLFAQSGWHVKPDHEQLPSDNPPGGPRWPLPSPPSPTASSRTTTGASCRPVATPSPDLFFPVGTTGPAIEQIAQAKAVCAHLRGPGRLPRVRPRHQPGLRRLGRHLRGGAPQAPPGLGRPPAPGQLSPPPPDLPNWRQLLPDRGSTCPRFVVLGPVTPGGTRSARRSARPCPARPRPAPCRSCRPARR